MIGLEVPLKLKNKNPSIFRTVERSLMQEKIWLYNVSDAWCVDKLSWRLSDWSINLGWPGVRNIRCKLVILFDGRESTEEISWSHLYESFNGTRGTRLVQKIECSSDMWLGMAGDEKEKWDWGATKSCWERIYNGGLNRRTIDMTFVKAVNDDEP